MQLGLGISRRISNGQFLDVPNGKPYQGDVDWLR